MFFADGTTATYEQLVSTMPLPAFVAASVDAPDERARRGRGAPLHELPAASTSRPPTRPGVTSCGCTSTTRTSSASASASPRISRPTTRRPARPACRSRSTARSTGRCPTTTTRSPRSVVDELVEMGLVDAPEAVESTRVTFVPQGNPIFDLRPPGGHGGDHRRTSIASVCSRVGRYAEWKYLMTDACVISARRAAGRITGTTVGRRRGRRDHQLAGLTRARALRIATGGRRLRMRYCTRG